MAQDHDMLETLARQVDLYRRLARLAERQHDLVGQDRTDDLLDLLRQRQTLLSELSAMDSAAAPLATRWNEMRAGMPAEAAAHAEALLREIRSLLRQITECDARDSLVLQQRKLDVGRELRETSSARDVNRRYAASAYGRGNVGGTMDVAR